MNRRLQTRFCGVEWLRIGDVAKTAGGSTPSRSRKDYWAPNAGSGTPWVKTAEIAFEPILKTSEAITETALQECSLRVGPPGTVLIAMFGEGRTRGQSAVLKVAATFNQACFAVFPNEAFDPDYLQLWLMKQYLELRQLAVGRGGSQANLNGAILEDLKAPWIHRDIQREFVMAAQKRLSLVSTAQGSVKVQESELRRLADSIVFASLQSGRVRSERLGDVLNEIISGIGDQWAGFPVHGATRAGLAPARERPGKNPERYKPVDTGTVFYNPMRIRIGSIAFVDDDDEPGITSPDYVVLKGKPGVVDSRWFYYWLGSPVGERCIQSLARGAVRERMLFNRLAEGQIDLPDYDIQVKASDALAQLKPMRLAIRKQIEELEHMPQKVLAHLFHS